MARSVDSRVFCFVREKLLLQIRRKELTTKAKIKSESIETEEVIPRIFYCIVNIFTIKSDGLRKENIRTSNCKRKSILFFHTTNYTQQSVELNESRLGSDC